MDAKLVCQTVGVALTAQERVLVRDSIAAYTLCSL
jgi:hypothetical protein